MVEAANNNWFAEFRFLKSDGTYALVLDRAIFIRDENGKAIKAYGAMTDISYRKEYEDSLKKLNPSSNTASHFCFELKYIVLL